MVYYCNDADKEAAEIIAKTFGVEAHKLCDPSVLDQFKEIEGDIILVGGENANPLVKRLVQERKIPPIASLGPNQCFIGRVIYGKARIWVLAGYEKEDTLFVAKLIAYTKSLPDIDTIEKIFGRNYLIFPRGREPHLIEIRPAFDVLSALKGAYGLLSKIPEPLRVGKIKEMITWLEDIINNSEQKITSEATYILYNAPSQVTASPTAIIVAIAAVIITALLIYGKKLDVLKEEIIWTAKQHIVELQTAVQMKQIEETSKIANKLIEEGKYEEAVEVINGLNKSISEVLETQFTGKTRYETFTETIKWVAIGTLALIGGAIVYKIWTSK